MMRIVSHDADLVIAACLHLFNVIFVSVDIYQIVLLSMSYRLFNLF